jgi:crossover junction endodeoxyribonuclease RuvC
MIILGIDPSNYSMGYGVIDFDIHTQKESYVTHGFIRETVKHYPETLVSQISQLKALLNSDKIPAPAVVSIEAPKDNKGFTSHQRQVELIGCIKALLIDLKISFIEIPPNTMKNMITGNGWASKEEVARAISDKYGIKFEDIVVTTYYKQGIKKGQIKSYILDGSDALALATVFPSYYGRVMKFDYRPR